MGYLYETMDLAKGRIQNVYDRDENKVQDFWDIIDKQWKGVPH